MDLDTRDDSYQHEHKAVDTASTAVAAPRRPGGDYNIVGYTFYCSNGIALYM